MGKEKKTEADKGEEWRAMKERRQNRREGDNTRDPISKPCIPMCTLTSMLHFFRLNKREYEEEEAERR